MSQSQVTDLTYPTRARRGWAAGLAALFILTAIAFWNYYPPLDSTQRLTLFFDAPQPGTSDPLIVTGEFGRAEFLYVTYLDEHTLTLAYAKWGYPELISKPVAYRPGTSHSLDIHLPTLQHVLANPIAPEERVRVVFDGELLIDEPVKPYLRRPMRVWFARNPVGGPLCGPEFRGRMGNASGRVLAGRVDAILSRTERLRGWLYYNPAQFGFALLASIGLGWAWTRLRHLRLHDARRAVTIAGCAIVEHRAFALTALGCLMAFAWLISLGSWKLIYHDGFGDFYDVQALSLLNGRLDVPEETINVEAFVYKGRYYGYFGITPALLRLPLVAFGIAFSDLTRAAMLTYFAACLVAAYLVLCDATRTVRSSQLRPPAWLAVIFTLNAGLGSTLFFLGSRAFIYHEAILCGAAFALWACWCALRQFALPRSRWWLGALACGTLAIHARPPAGLFALTLLGGVAVLLAWRERQSPRSIGHRATIGAFAMVGALSFNGLSYFKFETFEGCPLRLHVQYDAKRLARIEGKQFHPSNLPFTAYTYLVTPNFLIEPRFPWLFLNLSKPGRTFSRARMDYADRTLAFPYSMSGLSLLAVASTVLACRRKDLRPHVALVWAAAIPFTLAMFAAVAVAQRYTADFCPFLICAAAFGAAGLHGAPRTTRVAVGTLLIVATLWSIALTAAITVHYQGAVVWGVPDETRQNYAKLRDAVDRFFRQGPNR